MNPCCFFFLLLPWSLIELPLLHGQTNFHPDLLIFGTKSFYTFTLNLTIFLLVVKTTALTMNVAGVIKDGLLIAFSWSIIHDTITPVNLFLYLRRHLPRRFLLQQRASWPLLPPHPSASRVSLFFMVLILSVWIRQATGCTGCGGCSGSSRLSPGRLMLARSCRALEPTKRDDSAVHTAAAVEASDTAVGEEDIVDYEKLGKELEITSPLEIIDRALEMFGNEIAITFRLFSSLEAFRQKIVTDMGVFWNNGAEDVALIEYAKLIGWPFRAFNLDTGRLNPETYRFFDTVEKHYGINIEHMFPDVGEVHALIRSKGLFSFFEDGHQECCQMRKVRPLRRMLKGLRTWITGQRKDHSPGTRANIPVRIHSLVDNQKLRLKQQIEYYFRYLNIYKMDDQGWVPVSLIATFNMVKRVTTSTAVILNALRDSTELEIQAEKIRRREDWMRWLLPSMENPNGHGSTPHLTLNHDDSVIHPMQTLGLEESSSQATMSRTQTEVALDRGSTSCSCNSQQGRDPAQLEELCRSGSDHEIGNDKS
ncbi:hypothetical protein ZIOFF_019182 [Zingiber officinale]|uniref:HTH La-type RNA-binding domain-containing protein n=1 Tax=Zingiber officinale TaxID=94328 RepID=A0A8J5HLN2_ZINOF|nr:hypothetical protein ZIOFF_019182 [Zingiber officinale]